MTPYDSSNVFAKIIRKEIPCQLVYEDAETLAFRDIQPVAPVHVLVIPKGAYRSFSDFITQATPEQVARFFSRVHIIAAELGLEEDGYRLVSNHGAQAGQTVFHFHVHLIGGREIRGLAG